MPVNHVFAREAVLPSYWANKIQEQIATLATQLRLRRVNDTTVEVQGGASDDQVVVGIDGRWRFVNATVQRAHPGGAAGTYQVWVVAEDEDVDNSPLPYSDHTNYAWDLRITAAAVDPSGAGVEVFRKIGEIVWDGVKITRVRQLTGPDSTMRVEATSEHAAEVPIIAHAAAAQTADVLRAEDSAGARLASVDAAGRLLFGAGGDVNLYRSAANELKTDDGFTAARGDFGVGADFVRVGVSGSGGAIIFGSALDTNLYRLAADVLKTDDGLAVGGYLYVDHGNTGQKLWFGSGTDTNLYRSAANTLKTDDTFIAAGAVQSNQYLQAFTSGAADVLIGDMGGSAGGVRFGNDTYLYRNGVGSLYTPNEFSSNGAITSSVGGASRITLGGDGRLYFGSATDTNLYRHSADVLKTDDNFVVGQTLYVGAAGDTVLYRRSANQLGTDDGFVVTRALTTDQAFATFRPAEADHRFQIDAAGVVTWGSGSAARDTHLYRSAAETLETNSRVNVTKSVAGVGAFAAKVAGDSVERHMVDAGGAIYWGPGNAAKDVVLGRLAANTLFLSGGLRIDGNSGFYGTAPIAKQTGVPVTAAGVHAAMVNLGLIS